MDDTKTAARPRTLILRERTAGRKMAEPLCPFTARQIQKRWEAIREAVGRWRGRPKFDRESHG